MTVYFIGAGPGAADLITVRGARILAASPVCLYAGSLVPVELLAECPKDARLIDTANLDIEQITAELVRAHADGHDVARLHSGDPSVFSAVNEQMKRLDEAGVPYEVVPGVPAFAAAAAALKRELTVPTVGQTVILTRIAQRATAMPEGEDLATLGRSGALIVLHLAARYVDRVVDELLPHYGADCPTAVVAMASRPDEIILRGPLDSIAEQVKAAGVRCSASGCDRRPSCQARLPSCVRCCRRPCSCPRRRVARHGRPPHGQHHRLFLREPGVVDSAPPHDVITLLSQKDAAAGQFDAEAAADEDQESCALLAPHPLRSLIGAGMDAPLDLDGLAVARVADVLEVAEEPPSVQCRVLARIAHVHAAIHVAEASNRTRTRWRVVRGGAR